MNTLAQPAALAVQAAELKSALAALSRVIRGRVTLPILGLVKVTTCPAKQAVQLTATDLELSVSVEVPCLFEIEEQAEDEAFLVPLEDLQRVVKTASHSRQGIDLRSLRSAEEVQDFPGEPKLVEVTTTALGATELERLLQAFACASEDQTRYVLCGVHLDPAEGGRLIATDGRHLALFQAPGVSVFDRPFILPDHRFWGWRGIQEGGGCTLHLGTFAQAGEGSPGFRLEGEGWRVTGKGVEGNYPNYRQVLPSASQFVTRVELEPDGAEALAHKLEQLAKWKGTPAAVGLRVENQELHLLHREKADQDYAATHLPTSRITGAEMTVMLNRDYLIKAPRFGFRRLELIDPCSPVQFTGDNGLLIVMPLRLEGSLSVRPAAGATGQGSAPTAPAPVPEPEPLAAHSQAGEQQQEQQRQPEPKQQQQQPTSDNMKPTNGTRPVSSSHSSNGNGNGGHSHSGNGHRPGARLAGDREEEALSSSANGSSPSRSSSSDSTPGAAAADPMDAAVQQLALVRDTLRSALAGLGELLTTLKSVRQQQRDTEREIRTVRSTIRSLREINL